MTYVALSSPAYSTQVSTPGARTILSAATEATRFILSDGPASPNQRGWQSDAGLFVQLNCPEPSAAHDEHLEIPRTVASERDVLAIRRPFRMRAEGAGR